VDSSLAGAPMRNVRLSLNESGCLSVRSAAVGETYWPEKSSLLGGGAFHSTDLAELKEGQVFLRGRLSDEINVAGRKVSPETIERALLNHPAVSSATEPELKQFLLRSLPAWQIPREWLFVSALATTARGKISRAEWRRTLMSDPAI
jgi:acyl-CoA synthetase (AMP-forming)/AMP-acid ligase II